MDLICVGLTTLDILGRPIDTIPAHEGGKLIEQIELVPAGTAAGTALVASLLGLRTSLLGAVGDDTIGRVVRAELTRHGVDLTLTAELAGTRTSATILPIDSHGRRPTLHALGASMALQLTQAHFTALSGTRFVHYAAVGAPHLDAGPGAEFLRAAKQAGAYVTLDLISPRPNAMQVLATLLPYVDCFMPSLTEAKSLSGLDDPRAAARHFRDHGAPVCIIKRGPAGVLLASDEGMTDLPAFETEIIDTTSCGDSFCAGFIAGRARGFAPVDAARLGCATAALVAQGLGTLGKLRDFAQAEAYAATTPCRNAA